MKLQVRFDPRDHEPAIRGALGAIRNAGICMEINTSGLRRPVAEIYPADTIVRWAVEENVPLTYGSDAHDPRDVGAAWEQVRRRLLELGVSRLHRFEGRRRILVEL